MVAINQNLTFLLQDKQMDNVLLRHSYTQHILCIQSHYTFPNIRNYDILVRRATFEQGLKFNFMALTADTTILAQTLHAPVKPATQTPFSAPSTSSNNTQSNTNRIDFGSRAFQLITPNNKYICKNYQTRKCLGNTCTASTMRTHICFKCGGGHPGLSCTADQPAQTTFAATLKEHKKPTQPAAPAS
mmetsp:Transcript_23591/g.38765  ORF Transcript_23591/g.38765 Transcript_23591/m.38765 type:complete len:187 (-) Transcript_23591:27-587(-)